MGTQRYLQAIALAATAVLLTTSCAELRGAVDLPTLDPADVEPRLVPQTSRIFDARGDLITTFHGAENRTVVSIEKVPDHLVQAIVAIEDQRFFEHDGIDLRGIARAAVTNIRTGEVEEGGSTITQQLVKNRVIAPGDGRAPDTLVRKLREAALARQVEAELSKNEILERYVNTIYLGNGAYGVQAAAKTYFAKPVRKLSAKESATLAALIKAPERYDPYDRPRRAKARRNLVLDKMARQGHLGAKRAAKARNYPLGLSNTSQKRRYRAPYFVDYVKRLLVFHPRFDFLGDTPAARSERLFTGGLRIHTTIVPKHQKAAERAVKRVLTERSDPHASIVSLDPRNGRIKAMVGGRNFFEGKKKKNRRFSKLNLAVTARPGLGRSSGANAAPGTGRQAGSAFKPFALEAALESGIPLSRTYSAPPCKTFPRADNGGPWKVCNYGGARYGRVSLREATRKSINVAYAKLVLDVGPEAVVDTARAAGIRTDLRPVNSGALGTNPVNPLGMATGYATLANNGTRVMPVAITKILDHTGKPLYRSERRARQVLDPAASYAVNKVLKSVIRRGTGTRARLDRPAAGKTGTAQEYRDAWFVGSVPQLTAAVWVGHPEASISMKPYCGSAPRSRCRPARIQVTGGSWPAEIWRLYMTKALKGKPVKDFKKPKRGLKTLTIDERTGCRATASTPDRYRTKVERVAGTGPKASVCERARRRDKRRDDTSSKDKKSKSKNKSSKDEEQNGQDEPSPKESREPEPDPQPEPEPEPEPSDEPEPQPSEEPSEEPSSEPSPEPSPSGDSPSPTP